MIGNERLLAVTHAQASTSIANMETVTGGGVR